MVSLRVHSILDLDDEDADQDGDDASLDAEGDGQPAGEEDAGDPPGRVGAPKAGVKHPVAGKTGKPGHAAGEDDGGDAGRHKGDRGAAAAERGGDEVMLSPDSSPPAGVGALLPCWGSAPGGCACSWMRVDPALDFPPAHSAALVHCVRTCAFS